MRTLITAIRQRLEDPRAAMMSEADQDHPRAVPPPLSLEELARIEGTLSFRLPPLVRALYTEIGNGDFGPEYEYGIEALRSRSDETTAADPEDPIWT